MLQTIRNWSEPASLRLLLPLLLGGVLDDPSVLLAGMLFAGAFGEFRLSGFPLMILCNILKPLGKILSRSLSCSSDLLDTGSNQA